ncbi:MAG TPA: HNH endonuclease signature motif containing protein [Sphingobacterium sp.]|nr:HNH endonuclease signature motif containing protein [Sphingobacterium sp.]
MIKEILREASEPISAGKIAELLASKGYLGPIKNKPITQIQIRDRIREDKSGEIETIKTSPYTYRLKDKIQILKIQKVSKTSTNMEETSFKNWLKQNHKRITRPDKYVGAIKTISNDLKSYTDISSLFYIKDIYRVKEMYNLYFSIPDFAAKNSRGNRMYSRAFDLYIEYVTAISDDTSQDILDIVRSKEKAREKETLILARIGQGKFRSDLIKAWGKCAISGYDDVSLLIASHIKPWSKCNNKEKVDPDNGLLLLPNYDKLFDRGVISFDKDGSIMISKLFADKDIFGIDDKMRIKLKAGNKKYMEYHRKNIFKS